MEQQSQLAAPRNFEIALQAGISYAQQIRIAGNFFWIRTASDDVYVAIDGSAPFLRLGETAYVQDLYFSFLTIYSLVAQNIQIIAGMGQAGDHNQKYSVAVTANVTPGNQFTPLADVSVPAASQIVIAAANTKRLSLDVKNESSNAIDCILRIGDSTVAAAMGRSLDPGESGNIRNTAAIYAYNPGTTAATVTMTENNLV